MVPLTASRESDYDGFLATVPEALFYYSLRYRQFLQTHLRCESHYQVALEDGRVAGVLPLMRKEGPFGRIVNSLPYYGSNGGAIARSSTARSRLQEYYAAHVTAENVAAATWIENPLAPKEDVAHDLLDTRIGHFTDLTGIACADDLLARVDGSARRNVKTARGAGISISVTNGALDFLQRAHHENMAAIGGNAKSSEFFRHVPECFEAGTDYEVFIAYRGLRPIAGLLVFYFNKTVEYFTPVTLAEERKAQPMALILLEAMTAAAERGFKRWNWGGTWLTQEGVAKFKRKWGAEEKRYRYFVTVNDKRLLHAHAEELAAAYPGFYVIPYDRLKSS